ncbi:hypothetical protein [Winogradskyella sp.]|uniref:hypothetical protein n=1 Tax=Winogradskyella sp. TaxID=1883156 RepID=UPI00263A2570|nr:hypothetical protein [Winogradskyella sp.]
MTYKAIIDWLLKGDVSIQYQTHRDLLSKQRDDLQERIASEGFGAQFLSQQQPNGHWGQTFYQPKWISTHYTLLDICHLKPERDNRIAKKAIKLILSKGYADDGGIPLGPSTMKHSDVCVNALFLKYASYFNTEEKKLRPIVYNLLNEKMQDGGFNCRLNRSGAVHSSLHSTLSVLEGLTEYLNAGHTYLKPEVLNAIASSKEFMLLHQLFLSDKTGNIIDKKFLQLSYPRRWRYDILSALDYLQYSKTPWDNRMQKAIDVILSKRNKNGTWNLQAKHPGQTHFDMEKAGQPSRCNTLRALRVLKFYKNNLMAFSEFEEKPTVP